MRIKAVIRVILRAGYSFCPEGLGEFSKKGQVFSRWAGQAGDLIRCFVGWPLRLS
jgi:hypothetical protein